MESIKYFYTLSSTHRDGLALSYAEYTRKSIRTLHQVVDNPSVIICFTPPVDPCDVKSLKQYDPYIRENVPAKVRDPESAFHITNARIMNKTHVGEVLGEKVIVPDSNVMFIKDPTPLIEGDFDIAGAVLLDRNTQYPFLGCRFLIFGNNTQKSLATKWMEEFNDGEYAGDIDRTLYNAAVTLDLNIKDIGKEMEKYMFHSHRR